MMIGKRKRDGQARSQVTISSPKSSESVQNEDDQKIFQRYYESYFAPLQRSPTHLQRAPSEDDENSIANSGASSWAGLSSDEEGPTKHTIEVVSYEAAQVTDATEIAHEKKRFMGSKPPTLESRKPLKAPSLPAPAEEAAVEAQNLKHDLALQRLLQESHLLSSKTGEAGWSQALAPSAGDRHRAIDLRLQALGAKKSLFERSWMPREVRKGIEGKRKGREEKRRAEARETGVVLERKERREVKGKGKREGKGKERKRGIGGDVGRWKGGTLRLSRRDVMDIQGGPEKKAGKGRG